MKDKRQRNETLAHRKKAATMKRVDEEPTPKAIDNALSQDPLHRKREIEDFLKMLIAVEPPYTFVIDAPWGSGKTFFVKQVARVLQMTNPALSQDSAKPSTTFGKSPRNYSRNHTSPFISTRGRTTISTIRSCQYWPLSPTL